MPRSANLEFRKIKSLFFLYEVSEDGRIVRNVKSKKQIRQVPDKDGYMHCYFNIKHHIYNKTVHSLVAECWHGDRPEGLQIDHINGKKFDNHQSNLRYVTLSENLKKRKMSDRVIRQATANCYHYTMTVVAKPVILVKDGREIYFPSNSQCAAFLATAYGKTTEHMRGRLKQHRARIYDYDVIYLNAETGHINRSGKEQSKSIS